MQFANILTHGSLLKNPHFNPLQKLIRLPLRLIPGRLVVRVRSGTNKGLLWIVESCIHSCWLGTFETTKQAAVTAALKPGMVAWDIGANVGFYTLAFARKTTGGGGEVVAFEPLGANIAYLAQHVALNKLTNVTVVQAAVSDKSGMISFTIGAGGTVGKIVENSAYKIPAISLDDYMKGQAAAAPDLLKIDVEGAEASVLRGACNLLTNNAPEIWLALHNEQASRDCEAILRSHGYQFFTVTGQPLPQITTDEIIARKPSP